MRRFTGISIVLTLLAGCSDPAPAPDTTTVEPPVPVTGARIVGADDEPGNWLSHGRTYDEQRFSPLDAINDGNVGTLGMAWSVDFPTRRGLEATPIVVDGVMFTTTGWSMVHAIDAATGERLWSYDPQVPREKGVHACCDVVNRGVAVWDNSVFVGTLDGRLVSLDRRTGAVNWSTRTFDAATVKTITGAPRVIGGKVIIGFGGAEYGTRGSVSAYDAATGLKLWTFYTVPGNPADGFEDAAQERAAQTWSGEWWTMGGGGTVWDAMAYDPDLDLLYIGTGNGAPWNPKQRSPGGGDNLYLSSIVALHAADGSYAWHYQTTPNDAWDFTATQHLILADLEIAGVPRKVIMQAPKNGFFYVVDRVTGALISAEPFTEMNWATHVDMATGRPVETEIARYYEHDTGPAGTMIWPSMLGAHSWHPMAFNPATGYVYIPSQQVAMPYGNAAGLLEDPVPDDLFQDGRWNTGTSPVLMPTDPLIHEAARATVGGRLLAWDPIKNAEVWRVDHGGMWNGGLLSTAGNLLFQGNQKGDFAAYAADTGDVLWSVPAGTGIVAAPVTYTVAGEQYIAVMAGWGGAFPVTSSVLSGAKQFPDINRLLVFKLGATDMPEALARVEPTLPEPPARIGDAALVTRGEFVYGSRCGVCHGLGLQPMSALPDLRRSATLEDPELWADIILDGALRENGMAPFRDYLEFPEADVEAIRAYVIDAAHIVRQRMQEAAND